MQRGRLITVEGVDGAGKSTLATALCAAIGGGGSDVRLLREPGGVEVAERIRDLVKDPALDVAPATEALLYAAARAQLVAQLLEPLLSGGVSVVLDRFVDSSLAYQGAGRELGVATVRTVNELATGGLEADRTLLLRITPETARARQDARALLPDRLERENELFFARVAEAYDELARAEPGRIRVIDADRDPQTVLNAALQAVSDLF
ncbi:MAG TPA: dTMP kinase [Solirubrobacteraceae bacterium]|nr:dTMP kinase [Solirubrobacteraceae bacterium]